MTKKTPKAKAAPKKAKKSAPTVTEVIIVPFDEKDIAKVENLGPSADKRRVVIKKTKAGKVLAISVETNPVGREPIDKSVILPKLVECFKDDMTDEEACLDAGIGVSTYYRYMKDDTEFKEEIEAAKNHIIIEAKRTVRKHIEKKNDPDYALRILERRQRSRYALRSEVTGEDGKPMEVDVLNEARRRSSKYKTPRTK